MTPVGGCQKGANALAGNAPALVRPIRRVTKVPQRSRLRTIEALSERFGASTSMRRKRDRRAESIRSGRFAVAMN